MKLGIMQPYFFPYLGYFQCICAVDNYVLYGNLDYIKEGWMNRNRILIKNQQPVYINALIEKSSSNKKINEVNLIKDTYWRKKLAKSIELNYTKSPFFEEIYPFINTLIFIDEYNLGEYNATIIKEICKKLQIQSHIIHDNKKFDTLENELSDYYAQQDLTLNYLNKTKPNLKTARVIAFCKILNANHFINAYGGSELYSKDEFDAYGIKLNFIKMPEIVYSQFSPQFHPHLSIIDVLFHNGFEKTKQYINNYQLI